MKRLATALLVVLFIVGMTAVYAPNAYAAPTDPTYTDGGNVGPINVEMHRTDDSIWSSLLNTGDDDIYRVWFIFNQSVGSSSGSGTFDGWGSSQTDPIFQYWAMPDMLGSGDSGTITWDCNDTICPTDFEVEVTGIVYPTYEMHSNTFNTAVAPEPVSTVLFLVGGATLGIRRFSKKKVA